MIVCRRSRGDILLVVRPVLRGPKRPRSLARLLHGGQRRRGGAVKRSADAVLGLELAALHGGRRVEGAERVVAAVPSARVRSTRLTFRLQPICLIGCGRDLVRDGCSVLATTALAISFGCRRRVCPESEGRFGQRAAEEGFQRTLFSSIRGPLFVPTGLAQRLPDVSSSFVHTATQRCCMRAVE